MLSNVSSYPIRSDGYSQTNETGQSPTKQEATKSEPQTQTTSNYSNDSSKSEKDWMSSQMGALMKSQLQAGFEKPSSSTQPTIANNTSTQQSASTSNQKQPSAGVKVDISQVKQAIAPNSQGIRKPNQEITVTYEIRQDGEKRTFTKEEIQSQTEQSKSLRLTDEKGNLTNLGQQFDKIKASGDAVITEPGNDVRQLAALVNGQKPDPQQEVVIVAGLLTKGLVSNNVDSNGNQHLSIVPYKVASKTEILQAGQEALSNADQIKAILPGLKNVEGLTIKVASAYLSAPIAVATGGLGAFASGAISSLAQQTFETGILEKRLPTVGEAATSIVLGGGTSQVLSSALSKQELIEIGLTAATESRLAAQETVETGISTIFNSHEPTPTTKPTINPVTSNEVQPTTFGGGKAGANLGKWEYRTVEEVETIRLELLNRPDVGQVQKSLMEMGVRVDRNTLTSIKNYNFDSRGIMFEPKNYTAWNKLATGKATVKDAQYIVHEMTEVKELRKIQQETGFDFMGKNWDKMSTMEKRQWNSNFGKYYAEAHQKALGAEYDFLAQQVSIATNNRTQISRTVAAAADPIRDEALENLVVDSLALKAHPNFPKWEQQAKKFVEVGTSARERLKLPLTGNIALKDLIYAIKTSKP
ncbi:MAG: hypothetical protein HY819_21055 [Acidobacteria bacterium]|nr:hypothetical protein [Acidobacteriota bacterium]